MDKGDIQFVISLVLDLLGFFGIEWERIKGWLAKNPIEGAMQISRRQRFFEGLIVAGLLMSTWGWYFSYSNKTSPKDWMEQRKSLEQVYNRNFGPDDVIELDGKNIHDCNLTGLTIFYRGNRPFYWNHNPMKGDIKIKYLD